MAITRSELFFANFRTDVARDSSKVESRGQNADGVVSERFEKKAESRGQFQTLHSVPRERFFEFGHRQRRRDKSRLRGEIHSLSLYILYARRKFAALARVSDEYQPTILQLASLCPPLSRLRTPLILLPSFRAASRRLNESCQRRDVMNLRARVDGSRLHRSHYYTVGLAKYSLRVTGSDGNWAGIDANESNYVNARSTTEYFQRGIL